MRDRTLWALVAAEIVSSTGSALTFLALPWFVLATSHSPTRMSIVLAVEVLPMALFGIPSGTLVGRLGSRRMMLVSDGMRAPLIALVPLLHWTGHLSFGVLLVIVFLLGVFITPYISAQRTIIPELFGDDERLVSKASGLFGGAVQIPSIVGPALAGLLISWFGTPPLLVVDAATFLVAFVVVLLLVRGGGRVVYDDDSRGVLAGVRYLARDKLLGPVTLTLIVLDGSANAISVAVPLLAFTHYHQDARVAGWIFMGFGVGAVIGSVVVVKLLDRVRPVRLAAVGMLLLPLPIWAVVAVPPWPAVLAALFVCGLVVPLVNAPMMGIITTRPPAALRAKVMTAVLTASSLAGPGMRLLVGPTFKWHGNMGVWILLAGGMTLGALLFTTAARRGDEGELAATTTVA
ncbi:MAG TPA: MFS transporter [Gaiellaceae bacterium]|nr:MFS transporter [Gaiellaceae bacterium]